eukprot:CAMPEP_0196600734 /NCGR_PEP_ID=MMETSP1081-20130531/95545_1 /TAXON_ID=36882 /ORGANISM="Pyramimonas amylifera, Strain CCMP720" /LENGTH=122 /DNA_ID=CAMNT_0041926587 /DNA_START=475 /DNA_END=843 /DNA_ORIENTATION=+
MEKLMAKETFDWERDHNGEMDGKRDVGQNDSTSVADEVGHSLSVWRCKQMMDEDIKKFEAKKGENSASTDASDGWKEIISWSGAAIGLGVVLLFVFHIVYNRYGEIIKIRYLELTDVGSISS